MYDGIRVFAGTMETLPIGKYRQFYVLGQQLRLDKDAFFGRPFSILIDSAVIVK